MSDFQRRHYRAIAQVLREEGTGEDLIKAFADMLARDNGNFDRQRFLAVAKLNEPTDQTAEEYYESH